MVSHSAEASYLTVGLSRRCLPKAMAGIFHAQTNAWPLLVLAGSSESFQQGMGAFQELDQVAYVRPHAK